MQGKKVYFASDFHLGIDTAMTSLQREKLLVMWLDEIKEDAQVIYLVGDIFDFWYEYKSTVPKGFVRLLGKLAELSDADISIELFTGNHDMWMFEYLEKEIGVTIHRGMIERTFNGKNFIIGHGDGLGPGDFSYKFLKKLFANKTCQWLLSRMHPNLTFWIASIWSHSSRNKKKKAYYTKFHGKDERLIQYCESQLALNNPDYFVFGHRHMPIDYLLSNKTSRYINLGEWMNVMSYACFDGTTIELKFYKHKSGKIYH